jgi:hypothetical protein
MLSQLSYAPEQNGPLDTKSRIVGLPWLEQGTSVLSGLRSSQLSYRPAGRVFLTDLRQLESEKQPHQP